MKLKRGRPGLWCGAAVGYGEGILNSLSACGRTQAKGHTVAGVSDVKQTCVSDLTATSDKFLSNFIVCL